ncbi:hypothetical protein BH24ACT5_BH24ACT5_15540 [soil metagenome]
MSDEMYRRRHDRGDDSETDEYGGPLFPDSGSVDDDDASATGQVARRAGRDDTSGRPLSFGPNDTGPLPHWTDPPTGEIPRLAASGAGAEGGDDSDDSDEVDVWSTFTTESPIWRDDDPVTGVMPQVGDPVVREPSGSSERADDDGAHSVDEPSGSFGRVRGQGDHSGSLDAPRPRRTPDATGETSSTGGTARPYGRSDSTGDIGVPPRREPGRITIGTDPSGMPRRPSEPGRRRPGAPRTGRPSGPARTAVNAPPRNMSAAFVAGLVLAAVFVAALIIKPVLVLAVIVVVLAVAGWEYFGKVTDKGYRPAVAPGLAACVCAPLAVYWQGAGALPLVIAFAFMAGSMGFIGTSGVESGPLPNMAITTMGVVWIGLLGSYAALILSFSNLGGGNNFGTDTLFMVALGVAANDIGALVVGSAAGRAPLRAWISPAKTVEGVLGGTAMTILALLIASKIGRGDYWGDITDVLLLAVVIAVLAPLGDLTESMFKRNLEIKDFGTVVQGHGGVLDRFDGFLFVLPGVYYLVLVLFF